MKPTAKSLGAATGAIVGLFAMPSEVHAITCDALPNALHLDGGAHPPVLYVEGANAAAPLLAPLQQALSVDSSPLNVVFVGDGGCLGVNDLLSKTPIPRRPRPVYYAGEVAATCDLPQSSGDGGVLLADMAVSDAYAQSCGHLPGGLLPPSVGDFLGPVESVAFVVPKASSQRSISAGAAYFVFGFGSKSGVSPWTVNSSIYRRNPSSATQALLAAAIGVPLAQWAGVDASSLTANLNAYLSGAAAVVNALQIDPTPEQAIGILAMSSIDASMAGLVDVLAYKENGQSCAYYPDSTATARDKANVRDGHYTLWGPIHFFAAIDENGVPQNPNVARLISYLLGTAKLPGGADLVQIDAQNNLVPPCAMRVARTVEMGPLMSYAPPASCGCYYDYVATGRSSCLKCDKQSDCPASAPVCNLSYPAGFCETQ